MIAVWAISPTIETASIGIPDTMFLMLLALVVFGPRRLPEIGRQIGKLMYEFRKVSNDFKFQMEEELRASEEAERQRKLAAEQASRAANEAPQLTAESTSVASESAVAEPDAAANIGAETVAETAEAAPAVSGEVRGEPRKFPQIQPPSTGDPVAAQKPFRGRVEDVATESGDEASRELDAPVVVADEGRIGTEVQPGVEEELSRRAAAQDAAAKADSDAAAEPSSESGREVHHG